MFGYLRFFLAFVVMLSHIDVRLYGMNPGVSAVVVFYILAGFVVSHLYHDILPDGKYKLYYFFKDRVLRIFPLYLYIIAFTTLFLLVSGFGDPHFTFIKTLNNLLIVPLNYYMYIDSAILTQPHWWLIPPAWSLGTELQAYFFLALLFLFSRYKIHLFLSTFFIYLLANFSLIHPDYYGYRFIVGVFFIFIIGTYIHKKEYKVPLLLWSFILFILLPFFYFTDSFSPTYTRETFLGLLLGIPVVTLFSRLKIRLPYNSLLGSLSYGLFLSHFLAIWILQYFNFTFSSRILYILTLFTIALCLSYIGVKYIEKPIEKRRMFKK